MRAEQLSFLQRCEALVPQLNKKLSGAVRDREEDFLNLGKHLQEFARQAGDISEKARHLSSITSGELIHRISGELQQEMERMRRLLQAQASADTIVKLQEVTGNIDRLEKTVGEFKRIVRTLQMLGISTRIESARLGSLGRGFHTLADDVEKLAQHIVTHSGRIMDKSKMLRELSSGASEKTFSMQAKQESCTTSAFSGLSVNLEELVRLTQDSRNLSVSLDERGRQTEKSFGELVSSMQFHDITRQQVEHVEEALDDILSMMREQGDPGQGEGAGEDEFFGWIADVCDLQQRQVRNASEQFETAVGRLREYLREVAAQIAGLGDETRGLTDGGGKGASALECIEKSIRFVIDCMRQYAAQGEEIGRETAEVASTVEEMGSFLSDIEDVGAQIELIALNASVKAAHTGEEGKALGVLAQSIQQLSREARERTEAIADSLTAISQEAISLNRNAESYMDTSQVEEVVGQLEELVTELRDINDGIMEIFQDIQSEGQQLGGAVHKVVDRMHFDKAVNKVLDEVGKELERLSAQARELAPEDDQRRPERLRKLLERYTMDVERLVHEAALGVAPSTRETEGFAVASDGDFGDNVELF